MLLGRVKVIPGYYVSYVAWSLTKKKMI